MLLHHQHTSARVNPLKYIYTFMYTRGTAYAVPIFCSPLHENDALNASIAHPIDLQCQLMRGFCYAEGNVSTDQFTYFGVPVDVLSIPLPTHYSVSQPQAGLNPHLTGYSIVSSNAQGLLTLPKKAVDLCQVQAILTSAGILSHVEGIYFFDSAVVQHLPKAASFLRRFSSPHSYCFEISSLAQIPPPDSCTA